MINATMLDGRPVTINADLIETVESVPETLVVLTTGKRLMIKETREELKKAVLEYRRSINWPPGPQS